MAVDDNLHDSAPPFHGVFMTSDSGLRTLLHIKNAERGGCAAFPWKSQGKMEPARRMLHRLGRSTMSSWKRRKLRYDLVNFPHSWMHSCIPCMEWRFHLNKRPKQILYCFGSFSYRTQGCRFRRRLERASLSACAALPSKERIHTLSLPNGMATLFQQQLWKGLLDGQPFQLLHQYKGSDRRQLRQTVSRTQHAYVTRMRVRSLVSHVSRCIFLHEMQAMIPSTDMVRLCICGSHG